MPTMSALRAGRDSVLRADAIGINVKRMQWTAFVISGTVAGLAGALYAFSKGSISPESLSVGKSVDGLVMASDMDTVLFGKLNKATKGDKAPPAPAWQGPGGYVIE